MIKTGQILSVVSTANRTGKDGYQTPNGYICTFDMTIMTDAGPITGEIGSKSQVYPLAAGAEITVEMTSSQHGMRFKRQNLKFAGQQPQGRQMPQNPPQSTNSLPVFNTPPPRDYDRENHGKCFSLIAQAAVQRDGLDAALKSLEAIADLATACMNSYDYRSGQGGPNPGYDPDYVQPDDDIPY